MVNGKIIPIKDTQGREIGGFSFNPADADLPKRIIKLKRELPDITRPLYQLRHIRQDGTADGKDAAILLDTEARLFAAVDSAFGAGAAEGIFQKVKPFAVVSGGREFYCSILARLCEVALENIVEGE